MLAMPKMTAILLAWGNIKTVNSMLVFIDKMVTLNKESPDVFKVPT